MLRSLLLLIMLSVVTLTPDAMALGKQQPQVTKEQAANLAQQRFPGKVLKVQTENRHYRVRLIQADGRVITVLVDNRTGRVERDDK
ncbi:PepSY domain-containing protein [Arsukibacterium sp. UBA3155]|uniref:PepSY domain-containing protein n=1 Tax=Arsukibacterium sp. UBA3155 TaxID=1946058 RepID=UPI0025C283BF|nr:PepSY domain-containing protein [Arsukibacterium sp. UBA3155]|tara:strand:+ start:62602 stop:62859 length:258 start_codon:yes stop_codon:yes gene_type:complete